MKKTDSTFTKPKVPVQGSMPARRPGQVIVPKRRLVVKKWGNSAGLRIPMEMMSAAHLKINQEVEAYMEGEDLVLTPVRKEGYTLKELLDAITPENLHEPVETGAILGAEVW